MKREPHTLAGAYAMDAISEPDRARFEAHLARCEECTQEIASLREATARLATATALTPPSGLKERVMAAAAMTRQRPPVTSDAEPGSRPARAVSARAGLARAGLARAGPARAGAWLRSLAWGSWRVRLAVAAGAVAAVAVLGAAVVFGVSNGTMRQQLNQAQVSSQQIAAVLTARDATMMTGAVAGGGTATIVMSHARHALVFTAAGLRTLPSSRGYELWLIGPDGDRAVAMLGAGSSPMTGPVIASGLHSGDRLALTAGPAGGSSHPTAPMMLDVLV
jgi:hypothetical protein